MARNAPTVFDVEEVVDLDDDFTETTDSIYARFVNDEIQHLRQASYYGKRSHTQARVRMTYGWPRPEQPVAHVMDYHVHLAKQARAYKMFLENTGQLSFHYPNTDDGGPL